VIRAVFPVKSFITPILPVSSQARLNSTCL